MALWKPSLGPGQDNAAAETVHRGPIDIVLLTIVAALVGIGVLAVYSSSSHVSYYASSTQNDLVYFSRQASGVIVGFLAMFGASRLDYSFYRRHIYWFMGVGFVLLLATHIPGLAVTVNGSARWISLGGFRFQPAEYVKIMTVLFLAYSVAKKEGRLARFSESFTFHTLAFAPFVLLLMMQPDLGSSMIVSGMIGLMLFVGGANLAYIAGLALAGIALVWAAIQSADYRLERLMTWKNPWADASDSGYQLVSSYVAFARGGYSGTGLGAGTGSLGYVPELYNDFVAASVGEQFGLIGTCALICLFVLFVWRGLTIAVQARDAFGAYLAFGLTMLIGFQAAFNLCVVMGIVPTKGLTLPFVSYGRSSLVLLLFVVGVLMNIAQRNPDLDSEDRDERARMEMENTLRHQRIALGARRRTRQLEAIGGEG